MAEESQCCIRVQTPRKKFMSTTHLLKMSVNIKASFYILVLFYKIYFLTVL